ncbi:MAG: DUF6268 family outer membrane beta-barrel protein [Prevotellaceae bacterium]|jgi:hypothetical protein|nr:DUF6268 family outer membrane beta-barrel protein [Prevotellaceae bacterium]
MKWLAPMKNRDYLRQNRGVLRKNSLVLLLFLGVLVNTKLYGQIQIESSYMLPSNYRDDSNTKTGGKGDFKDTRLGLQIPVYMKLNELEQPTAWAIAAQGQYAAMNNTGMTDDLCIGQLLNVELGVMHMRPLSPKWSLFASLGGGVYTDLSAFSGNSILAQAGTLFIRRMCPNMDLGVGVALNNVLGYPMLFPSLYFDWKTGSKFELKISLYENGLLSVGYKFNDIIRLRFLTQAKGMVAMVRRNNKTMMFSQQFVVIGLQPEIYVNKLFSIPITVGASVRRETYFQERTLVSFFHVEENYPSFAPAAYISAGLKFFFDE